MWKLVLATAAALAVASCGPSGREVATAKTARYQGDKLTLFGAAKAAVESKHRIAVSDETTLSIMTVGRWHSPEGLASNWDPGDATGGGGVPTSMGRERMADRSFWITLKIRLLPEGDKYIVSVVPRYLQYRTGRGNLTELKPEDPEIPGWAQGKVDQLALEIYNALKTYQAVEPAPVAAPPPPGPPAGGW